MLLQVALQSVRRETNKKSNKSELRSHLSYRLRTVLSEFDKKTTSFDLNNLKREKYEFDVKK